MEEIQFGGGQIQTVTGKSTCSNELLPFLVEVEDLVQRKITQCVKEM